MPNIIQIRRAVLKAPAVILAAPVVFSLAWTGSASQEASGGATVNYTSQSFGAAHPNRVIAVAIGSRISGASGIVSSVTIDGLIATKAIALDVSTAGLTEIWYVQHSGAATSGTISVTFSTSTLRTGISVYRIITTTPTPVTGASQDSTGTVTAAISIPTGGGVLAASYSPFGGTSASWANATQDYQGNTTSTFTSAIATANNPSLSATSLRMLLAAASWGP